MAAFDDLALLRAFVTIVECGGISTAARRLRIPQPTLSRHLRTLEEQSGVTLLSRDTHRMSLTEPGHRLLADAKALLELAEEAEQRLREGQTSLSGHLRIFSTIDSGQFAVSRMISSFLQINPRVTADLAFTNRPLHLIEEGCDVGILAGKILDDTVVARTVGKISRYLAASPALVRSRPAAKHPADLKTWPWIGLSGIQFWKPEEVTLLGPKGAEATFPTSPVLTSEGVTSIRETVRSGLGIAVLPHWLIGEDIASGRLVRVLPQWKAPDLPLHVVYSSQRVIPVRVRAFIDFAVSYIPRELCE